MRQILEEKEKKYSMLQAGASPAKKQKGEES